ncbi:large ribosomal subunit protein uL23m-like [Mytilus edulis]|uniref:large ribosomal subunit protein uL23m-like n=1 Tax=Mytilus edulis TaxID=6550 RepID=UPI0039EE5364
MASKLAKFGKFHSRIPLWKQKVPNYPLYQQGGPQNRILLCHFWMKLIKPHREVPKNQVHFEVHPQMSKHDIKQYLEKIYNVPVLKIAVNNEDGKPGVYKQKPYEEPKKKAYVTLAGGQTFEYPDVSSIMSQYEKDKDEFETTDRAFLRQQQKNWDRLSIPPWFRR